MAGHRTLIGEFHARWNDPARAALTALVAEDTALTYAELADGVEHAAGCLRRAGVQRGDFVALAMERSVAQVLALLGTMAAGACPCPLEPRLSAQETARRIQAVGIRWLVYDAPHAGLAQQCSLEEARCLAWDGRGEISAQPASKAGGVLDAQPAPNDEGLIAARAAVSLTAQPVVNAAAPLHEQSAWDLAVPADSAALLLFTSGSTGHPKGVLLNHRGLLNNARGVAAHTGLGASDRLLHVMPLHHTNAINNQVLAPLYAGASVALGGRFRAEDMPALLQRYKPTIITGVPTMYARMLDLHFEAADLARLRFARCGSAPITEELHGRIEAFLGCDLVVSYGLSEATCTSTMNPPHACRIGSVGTVLAGQEVVLRNADGSEVPVGAEGEICILGDSLMMGYLGQGSGSGAADSAGDHAGDNARHNAADAASPETTRRTTLPTPAAPDGGVLRTGDLGRFDGDGYLYVTGRIKDVIIRGGENISPAQIERLLAALPGVASCCVVAGPHADLGEVPVAFVVADDGVAPDEAQLRSAVLRDLGRIYVPERIIAIDALPENAVGKVDRKALAALLREAARA
jgi:acyl-CoA synthetase (AMP-forming)/AMP-acid ligase II